MKEELRFLTGLRRALGVTMSSSQEGKGLVHVDVDTVGENTYTYTHTAGVRSNSGCLSRLYAVRWEIPCSPFKHFKRAELLPLAHPSVGQVAQ